MVDSSAHSSAVNEQEAFRILIVDSTSGYRDLADNFCRPLRYEASQAKTLNEALFALNEGRFDLVLLDICLSDSMASEALLKIREAFPRIPIIALGEDAHLSKVSEALHTGADDYLIRKHFTIQRFSRVVSVAYERKKILTHFMNQEHQLALLTGKLPAIIWTVDERGVVSQVFGRTREIAGVDSSTIANRKFVDIFKNHGRNITINGRKLMNLYSRSLNGESGRCSIRLRDRWLDVYMAPIDESGAGLGAVGLAIDVTASKKSEFELKRANVLALEASKAKTRFLSSMSHDIRTPINSLVGAAQLLEETRLNSSQQKLVQVIRHSSENLLALVNDILDLSTIERGKLNLKKEPFNLCEVCDSCVQSLENLAFKKGLALNHISNVSCDTVVDGDENRLRQVLINLLSNAIKFTDSGVVTLSVSASKDLSGGEKELVFEIIDTGSGIEPERLPLIFEEFERFESGRQAGGAGTGLGLPISKRIIESMGGSISVWSEVNKGSRFTVRIPFMLSKHGLRQEGVKVEALQGPYVHACEYATSSESPKILVVDDVEDNRFVIGAMLRKLNITATFATNGKEALEKIKDKCFDMIFMDMQMPIMDGYIATQEIRKWEIESNKRPLCIVALTASAMAEERQKCLDVGCSDFMAKPIRKTALLEKLNCHIGVPYAQSAH